MFSKEELNALIDEIAGNAQRNQEVVEIEAVIAQIKADILKNVGEKIGILTMTEMLGHLKEKSVAPDVPVWAGGHVAYQIAEAAEMIMRRAWIEKK